MKTKFNLDYTENEHAATAEIIGKEPKSKPYVSIEIVSNNKSTLRAFVHDRYLELFAVNILKALKSKRLKP